MKKILSRLLLVAVLALTLLLLFSCGESGDAKITVKSYFEELDGTYREGTAKELSVSAGAYTYTPEAVDGYTVNTGKSRLTVSGAGEEIAVYYDLVRHTVTFDTGALTVLGGSTVQTVPHGGAATAPILKDSAVAKFVGWSAAFDKVTGDLTVSAVCDSDATVTVNIYKENAKGEYLLDGSRSVTVNAALGDYTYTPESIPHFSVNAADSKLTCTPDVKNGGTVSVYYARNVYTVRFEIGSLTLASGSLEQRVRYGTAATPPTVLGSDQVRFVRWDGDYETVTGDVTVTAVTDSSATVKVEQYREKKEGGYELVGTETVQVSALTGSYTYQPAAVSHFNLNADRSSLSATLAVGRESTVQVYYDRVLYPVTFEIGALTLVSGELSQSVKYGCAAVAPVVERSDAAIFVRWDVAFAEITGATTVTAVTDSGATVKVEHYMEKTDGSYELAESEVLDADAAQGSYVYTPESVLHFTLNGTKSTLTVALRAGEESVVQVYYDRTLYPVTFEIGTLTLVSGELVQSVKYGCAAVAPVVEDNTLARFVEWDTAFGEITGETTVKAVTDNGATVRVEVYTEQPDGSYLLSDTVETLPVETGDGTYTYLPTPPAFYEVNEAMSELTVSVSVGETSTVRVYLMAEIHTVTFEIGVLNLVSGALTQEVKHGFAAVAPVVADTVLGKFVEWDKAFDVITGDTTVTAVVNSDAKLQLNIFFERLDGSGYVPGGDQPYFTVDASTGFYEHIPEELAHYKLNAELSELTTELSVDETNYIRLYYDRQDYEVIFDLNGLQLLLGETVQSVPYEGEAVAPVVANTALAVFVKWDTSFDYITGNVTVKAVVDTEATVAVTIFYENLDGNYDEIGTTSLKINAALGTYLHEPSTLGHYVLNEGKSRLTTELSVGSTSEVLVYYDLERITVTFDPDGLEHIGGELVQSVPYGGAAVAPELGASVQYAFSAWNKTFDNVTAPLTVKAVKAHYAPITVTIYQEDIYGNYGETDSFQMSVDTLRTFKYSARVPESYYEINASKSVLSVDASYLEMQHVEVYFSLKRLTVTFHLNGLPHNGGGALTQYVPYGGAALAPEVESSQTLAFVSWDRAFDCVTASMAVKAKTTTESKITISIYEENLVGMHTLRESHSLDISASTGRYEYTPVADTGFRFNSDISTSSCTLWAGESYEIKIYYDRMRYTVYFDCTGLVVSSGSILQEVLHGASVEPPVVEDTLTLKFKGWDKPLQAVTDDMQVRAICDVYTEIKDKNDLQKIAMDLSGNYALTANISLAGTEWSGLGTFTGHLIGNGYTITGLTISGKNQSGLFYCNRGTIEGLTIKDASISYTMTNGVSHLIQNGFFCYSNEGVIKDCHLSGANSVSYRYESIKDVGMGPAGEEYSWSNEFHAGGFVCNNQGTLEGCTITGSLSFKGNTHNYFKVTTIGYTNLGGYCLTYSVHRFGGFAATNSGMISECDATNASISMNSVATAEAAKGNLTAGYKQLYSRVSSTVGTIAGVNNNTVYRCFAGTVSYTQSSTAKGSHDEEFAHFYYRDEASNGLAGENNGLISESIALN